MTARRYLGLDLASCTGYALAEGKKIISSGVKDFSIRKSEHSGHRGIKFYNFLLSIGHVDEIYYERIMFTKNAKSADHGELYKGLLMVLSMYAAGFGCPMIPVWPGTLKVNFAGHGCADKAAMCACARAMGWKGGQVGTAMFHDEVDAIALIVTELKQRYNIDLTF